MPKVAKELSPLQVKRITKPGFHAVGGVPGLLLRVKPTCARGWILRAKVGDRRRDMGLGGYPAVTLAQARERAREYRQMIFEGLDPVEERRKRLAALRAEQETRITFAEAWREFWSNKRTGLADKTARHWENSIERYALPAIGSLIVADIETRHIKELLEPLWKTKPVMGRKLRSRLEAVLSYATVAGYRTGDNPARWKDNLKELLPNPNKVHKAKHFRALPIDEAPEFLDQLRKREGNAARALEFAILTAARSGEVRLAPWAEIDLKSGTWTIPADRMKMDRPHVVPLPARAIELLKAQPHDNELVFPAPRGGPLSDMSLLAVLDRMDYRDRTTVHGFRAVFKSWALERTDAPDFVSEMALAHSVGDEIQKAYQRSDLMAKRRKLMRQWAQFLGYQEKGAKVVNMEGRG